MFISLLALSAIALWGVLATIVAVANDGYGPVPFDPNRSPA